MGIDFGKDNLHLFLTETISDWSVWFQKNNEVNQDLHSRIDKLEELILQNCDEFLKVKVREIIHLLRIQTGVEGSFLYTRGLMDSVRFYRYLDLEYINSCYTGIDFDPDLH